MFNDGNVIGKAIINEISHSYQDAPLLYYLVEAAKGQQLLLQFPGLVEKITAEALNHIIPSGWDNMV